MSAFAVVCVFFGIAFLWDWNENPFQSCGHCWVFQICWHIECSTFTASSFRIWNSSAGKKKLSSSQAVQKQILRPEFANACFKSWSWRNWAETDGWGFYAIWGDNMFSTSAVGGDVSGSLRIPLGSDPGCAFASWMPSAETPEPFWALSSQNWQLIINKVLLQCPPVHRSGGGLTTSLTLLISLAAVSGWFLLAWPTEMESSRASGMVFCLWRCFEACHKFSRQVE